MALALDPRYVVEVRTLRHFSASPARLDHEIYVRRRIVAGLLVTLLVVATCLGIRSLASRGDGAAPVSAVTPGVSVDGVDVSGAYVVNDGVYIVQPGDTLWSIASSLTDDGIRGYVADLISLNGGASIDVGQRLALPQG
ncbi:MAG: LysM peptidoglycan-binding domain-containing protein [Actinomycetota bacterium]